MERFDDDVDIRIRVRQYDVEETYDVGEIVTITDDELMGFARVVRYEGDVDLDWICLQELHGQAAEWAAKELELSVEDWCDPLDD